MLLADKTAIVTGGTSGIGAAIAEEMARAGARVIFTGRNETAALVVKNKIERQGGQARFFPGDMTKAGFAESLVADILAKEGRIDILVNNAGILFRGTVATCTDDEWDATFAVNVTALFRLSRAILPVMREKGGGAIINIASDWALVAARNAAAYGASKGAVAQLTRSMAIDHAKENIRVNAICPGDTDTPMLETAIKNVDRATRLERLGAGIPMGRVASPSEIAPLAVFLASSQASYITGALIPVDGGNVAR